MDYYDSKKVPVPPVLVGKQIYTGAMDIMRKAPLVIRHVLPVVAWRHKTAGEGPYFRRRSQEDLAHTCPLETG
jgi:hypothetical protein